MIQQPNIPGAIALVGSGEYLDVMNITDTYLLETLGGANNARVALLPTASGREPQGPTYWNTLGLDHFQRLGVRDVRATHILDHESAASPEQLALLRDANLYYFSGGDPQHIIDTLRGSPAWEIIAAAHQRGAILAGCSAGAMALSGFTLAIRQLLSGKQPGWVAALGIIPNLVVFPHFDRMANLIDQATLQHILTILPEGCTAVGIDENTALVRIQENSTSGTLPLAWWRVMGQQTVTLFARDTTPRLLHPGEETLL